MTRISAESSASADLDDVCRWLIQCQGNPVVLDAGDLPAIGLGSRLQLALPLTAPRAILCALSLVEDDGGLPLLAGQLRFVAHPTASSIRLSFSGRTATAMAMGSGFLRLADQAARQLVDVIARSIERPASLARLAPAPT